MGIRNHPRLRPRAPGRALRRRPDRRRRPDALRPAPRAPRRPARRAGRACGRRAGGAGARMTSVPAAAPEDRRAPGTTGGEEEEMPRLGLTRRRALLFALFV